MREPDVPAQPPDPLSAVEHDLINSLASINGFGQLIRRDPSLPDDLRQSADLLVAEAARTRRMVQILLDAARQRSTESPTGGRQPVSTAAHEPVPPAEDSGAAPTATSTTPTATSTTATTQRPSVLVLDDEPTFRIFLEKALVALGYDPEIVARGADAVERANRDDHAVLIFDQQMPDMSGIEVYEAVVEANPDLASRIILMSGDVIEPGLEAFAAAHPVTLLSKPFELDTLDRTVRSVMDATGQSRG